MKIKYIFFIFLFILLIFSFSGVHALNETDTDVSHKLSVNKTNVNKLITKNEKDNDIKTAVKPVSVNDYESLTNQLEGTGDKTINLKKKTYKITNPITINSNQVSKNIVINGNNAVMDGSNVKSFLKIASNNHVTINNLNIKNTKAITQASGIIVSDKSSLTLNNCQFINCFSAGKGGAILNRGTTKINKCVFKSNSAHQGGAIWSTGEYGGSLFIENTKFLSNDANLIDDHERTAVVYLVSGGEVKIISNTFENNNGRSIHNFRTNLLVSNNVFKNTLFNDSKCTVRGAVIDNYEADAVIVANTFNNISVFAKNVRGGILYNEVGESLFMDNKITGLKVTSYGTIDSLNGGLLFNRNSTLNVTDNKVTNTNKGYKVRGGDLYNNIGVLNVYRNTFNTKNIASYEIRGGSIYNDKDGKLTGKLYYSANKFNLKNCGNVVNKTIHNMGIMKEKSVSIVKRATIVTVNPISAVVGNKITLTANVKDIYNAPVTGGSIKYTVGGKTLKVNGKFTGSQNVKNVAVKNGIAKITIYATSDISGKKAIKATYSGSNKYLANKTKTSVNSVISLRTASITLKSTSSNTKNNTIKLNVKLKDTTKNTKISVPNNNAKSYVSFKVNGVLLKNNGKEVKISVKNGVANYNYVVPQKILNSGITTINMTVIYTNPDYKKTSKVFKIKNII